MATELELQLKKANDDLRLHVETLKFVIKIQEDSIASLTRQLNQVPVKLRSPEPAKAFVLRRVKENPEMKNRHIALIDEVRKQYGYSLVDCKDIVYSVLK